MLPQSYKFSCRLCLNNFPQFWLIGNQIDQFSLFRYINRSDEVYCLVRLSKVLGNMKYLMMSVKQAAGVVRIWNEDNGGVNRENLLYILHLILWATNGRHNYI